MANVGKGDIQSNIRQAISAAVFAMESTSEGRYPAAVIELEAAYDNIKRAWGYAKALAAEQQKAKWAGITKES